jgi:glycosyltransferase involved in cell wall biosynthesis
MVYFSLAASIIWRTDPRGSGFEVPMEGVHRTIRVAHVLRSLEFGGAERLVVDLAGAQKASGRIVPELVCLESLGPLAAEAERRGLPCALIGRGTVRYLSAMRRMGRHFARTKPDVVHTHNFLSHVHAAPPARVARLALIHTKHGKAVTSFAWSKRFRRMLYELADRIVVVSRETGESFRAKSGVCAGKIAVIHNGIDASRFARIDRGRARRELDLPAEAVVFGCVSRLDPVKDHPAMLRAFAEVPGRPRDCLLVIVGDGPERDLITRTIRELGLGASVRLTGFTDDVPRHLASFDLFLQLSREEGLSLTILEAAATGVPIIASDVGGTSEIVENGKTGTLIAAGDVRGLAAAMGRFLADPVSFREMARKARETVETDFSLDGMAKRYEELYRLVLRERGA